MVVSVFLWSGASCSEGEDVSTPKASVWIEAENPTETNFVPGVGPSAITEESPGTSGAEYLTLAGHTPEKGKLPFFSSYRFNVSEPGTYRVWMAASPQDVGWTSPFSVAIDAGRAVSLEGKHWATGKYGNPPRDQFGWLDAGTVTLTKGGHVLRVEAIHPRVENGDHLFHGFIDAFLITQDTGFIPKGIYPKYSTQKPWKEVLAHTTVQKYQDELNLTFYRKGMAKLHEWQGAKGSDEVVEKLLARPLPGPTIEDPGPHEFGVHGMEAPFVRAGVNEEKVQRAYELLARVGVQSFRTAEGCWNRIGPDFNFKELDYQVKSSSKYGMAQLFTVGYPPGKYSVSTRGLAATRPEDYDKYRQYLDVLLQRYSGKHVVQYMELGNEVDALGPWWTDSTPEMYVAEMKMVHEEARKFDPSIKTAAFAATSSRDEENGGVHGGRRFVRKCLDLGISQYADVYSMHYTWQRENRDLPAFFNREEMQRTGNPKPLINSEETAMGRPSDMIKMFARDFFLYGMKSVDYYIARDWFEMGSCIGSGLFDLEWNPKPRLLAYAAAVDGMKNRDLVGIAEPSPGVEAYVLKSVLESKGVAQYSIVLWTNRPSEPNAAEDKYSDDNGERVAIGGWGKVISGETWNLDMVSPGDPKLLEAAEEPKVVFCATPPDWKLCTAAQWLAKPSAASR